MISARKIRTLKPRVQLRRAADANHLVFGKRIAKPLQIFLQFCLGILVKSFVGHCSTRQYRFIQAQNHLLRLFKTAIEKHCSENRLAGIGKNRRSGRSARFELTVAQVNEGADVNFARDLV